MCACVQKTWIPPSSLLNAGILVLARNRRVMDEGPRASLSLVKDWTSIQLSANHCVWLCQLAQGAPCFFCGCLQSLGCSSRSSLLRNIWKLTYFLAWAVFTRSPGSSQFWSQSSSALFEVEPSPPTNSLRDCGPPRTTTCLILSYSSGTVMYPYLINKETCLLRFVFKLQFVNLSLLWLSKTRKSCIKDVQ